MTNCYTLIMLFAIVTLFAQGAVNVSFYENQQVLSPAYTIYWNVSGDEINIVLQVQTTGWVGFGISEMTSGAMPGADIVTGWINATGAHIQDRYALVFDTPKEDSCRDWHLLNWDESSGKTTLELKRKLVTGDNQDRPIVYGQNRIIFAYGITDEFGYHGASNRGSAIITFFGETNNNTIPTENVSTATYTMSSVIIPAKRNPYVCQSFQLPNVSDAHVIRIDHVINNATKNNVHHMLVHACNTGDFWNTYLTPGECVSPVGNQYSGCYSLIDSWAMGMGDFYFPQEAGLRIGASTYGHKQIIVEIHYNNPNQQSGLVDNSGIRIHYTTDLRTHDTGVIILGDPFVSLSDLPANTRYIERETNCPSECTSQWPHDIHVFADFLHMHSAGTQMWSNHWTGNTFNGHLNRVDFYLYNLQQNTPLNKTIKRGDRINTHCVYDTTKRSSITKFGIGSEDEMCMEFVAYYPLMVLPEIQMYCGYFYLEPADQVYSLCGNNSEHAIKAIVNPSIPDPPGTGNVTFGTQCSSPLVCSSGQFFDETSRVCVDCEANTYAPQAGSTSCIPCGPGQYSNAGSSECSEKGSQSTAAVTRWHPISQCLCALVLLLYYLI